MKTSMFNHACILVVVGFLAGCQCPPNEEAGFPQISCQPVDVTTITNGDARFTVVAKGKNLTYQWFFGNEGLPYQTNAMLTVTNVTDAKNGTYYCEVYSRIQPGDLRRTRTRDALLGTTDGLLRSPVMMMGTNVFILTAETGVIVGGSGVSTASGTCAGTYCNYKNFNNAKKGFKVATTTTTAKLEKLVGTVYQTVPLAEYDLYWRHATSTNTGCAMDLLPDKKQFTSLANNLYTFTVYINPGYCTTGSVTYRLTVEPTTL